MAATSAQTVKAVAKFATTRKLSTTGWHPKLPKNSTKKSTILTKNKLMKNHKKNYKLHRQHDNHTDPRKGVSSGLIILVQVHRARMRYWWAVRILKAICKLCLCAAVAAAVVCAILKVFP